MGPAVVSGDPPPSLLGWPVGLLDLVESTLAHPESDEVPRLSLAAPVPLVAPRGCCLFSWQVEI